MAEEILQYTLEQIRAFLCEIARGCDECELYFNNECFVKNIKKVADRMDVVQAIFFKEKGVVE